MDGVSLSELPDSEDELGDRLHRTLKPLVESGHLVEQGDRVQLSRLGILFYDEIASRIFLDVTR